MSAEPLDWTGDGPRSPRFGDVYFSKVDGLAESRAVYLAGCGLPEAWAGRRGFTVAELGFGTGLNILALLDLWRNARPPEGRLHIFSVEGFPIGREDAARALAAWPDLADLANLLLAAWPDRRGLHRIDFPTLGATLDLAIAEAHDALRGWNGRADAWLLDGFAPALNPEMWTDDLMALVAARSAPGARAATFTVAGQVRRALTAAGFAVEKRPGFGHKRERLEAWAPGLRPASPPPPRVAVIGGGIAGAALARALSAEGCVVTVFEAAGPGAGASGNPVALVTPRLDAGLGPLARLHAQAFARAVQLYADETPQAVVARGAIQRGESPRDPGRFDTLQNWDGFAGGGLRRLSPSALMLRDALVVEPAKVLAAWLAGAGQVCGVVAALDAQDGVWRLLDAEGAALGEADAVCLAAGPASARLADLPLRTVRGQVSWTDAPFEGVAESWGGYVAPMAQGFLFGATHDRDDVATDLRDADHLRNLAALAEGRPDLTQDLKPETLSGRASLRAAGPDHMPLAGTVPGRPGLYGLSGLGGRGFTLAPLLAEQIAAQIAGTPRPLPTDLSCLVEPGRFAARGRKLSAR